MLLERADGRPVDLDATKPAQAASWWS